MFGILKEIRSRLVQGHRPAASDRVNGLAGVELAGGKAEPVFVLCHRAASSKGVNGRKYFPRMYLVIASQQFNTFP
jgi:hypothetical protein